jgi:hypothetical protein
MLMQYSSADKRRVYLAYRTVFAGPNAQLRKHKKVREVIQARQNAFRPLINDFGVQCSLLGGTHYSCLPACCVEERPDPSLPR